MSDNCAFRDTQVVVEAPRKVHDLLDEHADIRGDVAEGALELFGEGFENHLARHTRLRVHVLRDARQRPLVAGTLTLLEGLAFPRLAFPRGSADEVTGQVARAALVEREPRRDCARLGFVNVPCRRLAEEVGRGAKRIREGRGVGFDGLGSPCVRIHLADLCVALRRGRDGREEAVQL